MITSPSRAQTDAVHFPKIDNSPAWSRARTGPTARTRREAMTTKRRTRNYDRKFARRITARRWAVADDAATRRRLAHRSVRASQREVGRARSLHPAADGGRRVRRKRMDRGSDQPTRIVPARAKAALTHNAPLLMLAVCTTASPPDVRPSHLHRASVRSCQVAPGARVAAEDHRAGRGRKVFRC
jgi:hypothetical protein